MTPAQLLHLLHIVGDALYPETQIADLVINDYNVSNDNIDFVLRDFEASAREFVQHNPGEATIERTTTVRDFLVWLRLVPELERDNLMDWLDAQRS